jgi:hypothetical protein
MSTTEFFQQIPCESRRSRGVRTSHLPIGRSRTARHLIFHPKTRVSWKGDTDFAAQQSHSRHVAQDRLIRQRNSKFASKCDWYCWRVAMHIDITPDRLLGATARCRIVELSNEVYPPGSIPDWAGTMQWAPKTIRTMVWNEGLLVCHVGALVRDVIIDGRLAQVGNDCTGGSQARPRARSARCHSSLPH